MPFKLFHKEKGAGSAWKFGKNRKKKEDLTPKQSSGQPPTAVAQGQADPAELRHISAQPVDLSDQTATVDNGRRIDDESQVEEQKLEPASAEEGDVPTTATATAKPMGIVAAQSTRRQRAEQNLSAASKLLTEALNNSSSIPANAPQNVVEPQHTTEDIETIANMIASAIDSWQTSVFDTKEARSQFRKTAIKWFTFSYSNTVGALKVAQVRSLQCLADRMLQELFSISIYPRCFSCTILIAGSQLSFKSSSVDR